MAKRTRPREQESGGGSDGKEKDAKVVIYCRINPATVAALDEIGQAMRPQPTRAQLIDAACAEYVERHRPKHGRD